MNCEAPTGPASEAVEHRLMYAIACLASEGRQGEFERLGEDAAALINERRRLDREVQRLRALLPHHPELYIVKQTNTEQE